MEIYPLVDSHSQSHNELERSTMFNGKNHFPMALWGAFAGVEYGVVLFKIYSRYGSCSITRSSLVVSCVLSLKSLGTIINGFVGHLTNLDHPGMRQKSCKRSVFRMFQDCQWIERDEQNQLVTDFNGASFILHGSTWDDFFMSLMTHVGILWLVKDTVPCC